MGSKGGLGGGTDKSDVARLVGSTASLRLGLPPVASFLEFASPLAELGDILVSLGALRN